MNERININQQAQNEAYDALVAVSSKHGIDFVTILDDDIFNAIKSAKESGLENADELLSKLTPEVCRNIRAEFNELICEHWSDCLEQAINSQINSDGDSDEEIIEDIKNDA